MIKIEDFLTILCLEVIKAQTNFTCTKSSVLTKPTILLIIGAFEVVGGFHDS